MFSAGRAICAVFAEQYQDDEERYIGFTQNIRMQFTLF